MNEEAIISNETIKNRIHTIRAVQVMLDSDLAELYGIPTKALNQAVKRNIARFPEDFMFQLTDSEKEELVTECDHLTPLKFSYQLPNVFTEQGVASLSGVLKSEKAIEVNIHVIRAFVSMRRFISKNAELFRRLDTVERKQLEYDNNFERVFNAIENKEFVKKQGIFFDGQIFDAYNFVSDLIRSAKKSIVLIDNFVDDSVLTLFSKRSDNVNVIIYTKTRTKQLRLDLEKYNSQYPAIDIKEFDRSHDRFLIIDNNVVYHIGASLKDLGKKWFAFSKFDKDAIKLLDKLE
ncbi:MAG: ORF6N domain-containing protein [archaeon]